MTNKNKCPLCPKEYQSMKQLERHCLKIHGCSYKEAKVRELILVRLEQSPNNVRIFIG